MSSHSVGGPILLVISEAGLFGTPLPCSVPFPYFLQLNCCSVFHCPALYLFPNFWQLDHLVLHCPVLYKFKTCCRLDHSELERTSISASADCKYSFIFFATSFMQFSFANGFQQSHPCYLFCADNIHWALTALSRSLLDEYVVRNTAI